MLAVPNAVTKGFNTKKEYLQHMSMKRRTFTFLDYGNGEVIDAGTKGAEARFINHSCDPNRHIEK